MRVIPIHQQNGCNNTNYYTETYPRKYYHNIFKHHNLLYITNQDMSNPLCQFFYWSLLFLLYTPYIHTNMRIINSYSYGYDKIHATNSFAHHKPYTLFLLIRDEQVLVGRLIPCIKKDPKII